MFTCMHVPVCVCGGVCVHACACVAFVCMHVCDPGADVGYYPYFFKKCVHSYVVYMFLHVCGSTCVHMHIEAQN